MNRSHIKITNNFLLVFSPNKTRNLLEIRISQNLANLGGGGIELETVVQLGGGGEVLTLALILESVLSLKRVFWDLNGVGVVKER